MARPRTITPSRPDDARARRSVDALRGAFLALLETKPLEEIPIKEITERAGVSYPTFFRRYAGKGELLDDIAAEEVRRLLALGQAAVDRAGTGSARELCAYVHQHRHLWSILLNGGAANTMREEFRRIAEETAHRGPRANPWLPIELAVPFVTSAIFEILAWWMRQPEDYPLDKVVQLFDALIVQMMARPRDIAREPSPARGGAVPAGS